MLPEPPFPIAASWNLANPIKVTFSTWLTPGPLNPFNWTVRWNNVQATAIAAEVVPSYRNPVVHLTPGLFGLNPGPNVVAYIPPPFDLTSRIGDIQAPGFFNFPLGP